MLLLCLICSVVSMFGIVVLVVMQQAQKAGREARWREDEAVRRQRPATWYPFVNVGHDRGDWM